MNEDLPELSVVVVGRDGWASLMPILTCLAEQTIAARMEVIAVMSAADAAVPVPEAAARAFGALRVVTVPGPIGNRGRAAAPGMRAARAPVVAFSENHCFPDPDWGAALVAAYRPGIAGVAPAVLNANPETALSWCAYGGGYAVFDDAAPAGEIGEMPMHNTSYLRAAVAPLDNELDELLADERRLQRRLAEAGGRFLFHPAARTRHINEATYGLILPLNAINGRRYGGRRGEHWGLPKRLAYAAAFPLLSINVLRESLRRLTAIPEGPKTGAALVLATWAAALAHAWGEAKGYLFGPKDTFDFLDLEEFMILERLGGVAVSDPRLARFVALASPLRPTPEGDG